ncbi:phage tail tip lysozyme [Paraburkholderia xenovorans]|uniref:phage tail tip lysozyme n=1 Tax=Paraburkholderia xenovorans TaxID=36873 RepID=UPI0038BE09CE
MKELMNRITQMISLLQQQNKAQNPGDGGPSGIGAPSGHSHHRNMQAYVAPESSPAPATPAAAPAASPAASPASSDAPVNATRGADNSDDDAPWGGLSTDPQTTALTESQGHAVAEQYITNLQKDFGLTREQAEGIVANLWHESGGMNSGINQGGEIGPPSGNMADDNNNGYGIAQWGGARKQALIDYAHEHGIDPSSQAANYGYLKQELQTSYSGAIDAVKATSTAAAATEAFSAAFEQPSDPEMASRLADLQDV